MIAALEVWHASLVEILWTLFGLIGCYFGYKNLRWSKHDIEALNEMNGHTFEQYRAMRVIAYGHYRNDLFRMAKHFTVLVIGVLAMIVPSTKSTPTLNPVGLIVTGGLFTLVLLMTMASALDRKQREALEDMGRRK